MTSIWRRFGRAAPRQTRAAYRPRLEGLEERLVPATRVWAGSLSNPAVWSLGSNWVGGVAPVTGDDLGFDNNSVGSRDTTNDLPATQLGAVNTLTFSGSDYMISGNGFDLTAGLTSTITNAGPVISLPLRLTGPQTFTSLSYFYGVQFTSLLDLNGNPLTLNVPNGAFTFTAASTITGDGGLTIQGPASSF
jgi:hypothetical protein